MATVTPIRPGQLIARLSALLLDNAVPATIAVVGLTVLITAADLVSSEVEALILSSVASAVGQYLLLRNTLGRIGLLAEHPNRAIGSFILASILIGLGLVLGVIALVIPALILALRWTPALPLVLGAERLNATDALEEAMRRTKGQALAILPALLLTVIPNVASVVLVITEVADEAASPLAYGAINLLANIGVVASIYLSVAVYQETLDPDRDVRAVFD